MSNTSDSTSGRSQRGSKAQFAIVTAITLSRAPIIILSMVCAVLDLAHPSAWLKWTTLALMALSAITDLFDGQLARKWNVTSRFGALCDPLMDKFFFAVVFPTLTAILFFKVPAASGNSLVTHPEFGHAVLMLFFTVLYLLRDQWVSFLRAMASGKADMRATWVGKIRTAISFPIGCLLYAYIAFGWGWLSRPLMEGLEIFAILVSLYSIFSYTRYYGFALKGE